MNNYLSIILISLSLISCQKDVRNDGNKIVKENPDSILYVNEKGELRLKKQGGRRNIRYSEYHAFHELKGLCADTLVFDMYNQCTCYLIVDSTGKGFIDVLVIQNLAFEEIKKVLPNFRKLKGLSLVNTGVHSFEEIADLKSLVNLMIIDTASIDLVLPENLDHLKGLVIEVKKINTLRFPKSSKLEILDLKPVSMLDSSLLFLKKLEDLEFEMLDSIYKAKDRQEVKELLQNYFENR